MDEVAGLYACILIVFSPLLIGVGLLASYQFGRMQERILWLEGERGGRRA